MNLALIIAGGTGNRTGFCIPKQFIQVDNIPVIVYTLKKYQNHPLIDAICVVSLNGWEQYVYNQAQLYKITKLKHITTGGKTGQDSIYNGLIELNKHYNTNDFVLIHDAVRPIIPDDIIDDAIVTAQKYGNAVSGLPVFEALVHKSGKTFTPHGMLYRAQAPQCFRLGHITQIHTLAKSRGITNSTTSATLMIEMGQPVFFSRGTNQNIKLTTSADFTIFQAILETSKNEYNFDI
ncbi:MAG: 2-C-methyl-D-erythritol 4-phosphate cytidylyltransferase [Alphaproteobacteria bacterium]|nr:2-C-methyl-D-erythritol 4-phosphate cytidylyltransferase [Alphaproteobacteria bacterium]